MKSKEKERLVRNRGHLLRTLDVTHIIDVMKEEGWMTSKDVTDILADPARRQRATRFLDILEKKKTPAFYTFLDSLEEQYTHLYLILSGFESHDDDEEEDDDDFDIDNLPDTLETGFDSLDYLDEDEWSNFRRRRPYLIDEIEAARVAPPLLAKSIITDDENREVMAAPEGPKQTEVLLDILETKTHTAVEVVIDAIGEVYPHIYLMLKEDGGVDDLI